MKELKILLVDLELSYAIGYFFPSKREQYISARQIKNHQWCVCIAWKWAHEVSTYTLSVKRKGDDREIAKKLWKLFDESDVIVAHNGDAFDIKWANTLFIKHGLSPVSESKSIDTLKVARRYFNFAGNSLGDLLRYFKLGDKDEKPDWQLLTEGDMSEIKKATKYCKVDVLGLEKIFVKLRPYIKNFPTLRAKKAMPTECDACGCKAIQKRGVIWIGGRNLHRMKCMNLECGHEHKIPLSAKNV